MKAPLLPLAVSLALLSRSAWNQDLQAQATPLSAKVHPGIGLSSNDSGQTTSTQARGLASMTVAAASSAVPPGEPLGPCTRRTGLVISEIMYHPPARADGRDLAFVELFNSGSVPEDLGECRLSGEVDYVFAPDTVIAAGGFLVVAPVPPDVRAVYGITNVLGGFANRINKSSGMVRLRNRAGAVLLEINYSSKPPWPAAADGAGHSLVLARPSYGEGQVEAWAASDAVGGSPGQAEVWRPGPLRSVVINELLAHTDPPLWDYLELYNHSNQAVDLSGCSLSDDPLTNKFLMPSGTTIPARGYVYFEETALGFALSSSGETVYFRNPDGTRILDAVRFEAQENGVAYGRYPDGAGEFYRLRSRTPGAANVGMLVGAIVINEIMYHPISGETDDQYVELYNQSTNAVDLSGWRFVDGIDYQFRAGTQVAGGGYVVVAKNAARLLTRYANLNATNTVGDFGGKLSGAGERVALAMPHPVLVTNLSGGIVTNWSYVVVDEVQYGTGGRWGMWADGGGSSLELIDSRSNHRLAANWADSDETAKAPWTAVETTGVLDNGKGGYPVHLQILLQGEGECLVDNVEVIGPGGSNLVGNPTFEDGITGWVVQGTHDRSGWETTDGFGGSGKSLHVRCNGRGDPGGNRIYTSLASPGTLSQGAKATIRARVRWLKGCPEILFRLRGGWLEAVGEMALPANPGTPGTRNSRAVANAGPAIFAVAHAPVLPAANQPVVVTAQADDPDGLAQLVLNYRVDPNATLASVAMVDNGTGGDAVAGDGIFTATIPGQASGRLIAFHIQAADNAAPNVNARFPADAPTQECLVRYGEPQLSGTFPTYRLWMTQGVANSWASRLRLHNGPLDITFVYGNQRAIYNAGACYAGSPFIRPGYSGPTGGLCGYSVTLPADNPFLGKGDLALDWPIRDSVAQSEQVACWMIGEMGVPFNFRRFIFLFVNGQRRGDVYEDAQRPDGEFVKEWSPDDTDGDLHKVDDWFEFSDDLSSFNNTDATLQNFTTTGNVKKTARYRWNWRKRAIQTSANDYANLFALVDALNTAGVDPYTASVERLADVEEWMRVFCLEHVVGNWDSYGYNRGKNMYAYKPQVGKWLMMTWDIDFVLGAGSDGATTSLFNVNDPTIGRMYTHPPFRRAYFRAMFDAVNGPLLAARVNPLLDAHYQALRNNGVAAAAPTATKSFIQSRRNFLLQQLNTVAAGFAITSNGGQEFSTANGLLTLAGTAPVGIKTLTVNGVAYPVTWTTVTAWNLRLPLQPGTNVLTVRGYDSWGRLYTNATAAIAVNYTGPAESPNEHLVFNEIMYHPATAGAEFIELFNHSTTSTFDLSGWRLNGVDFTFGSGTLLGPQAYLVVARDRRVFAAVYGTTVLVAGEYAGALSHGGEALSLIKPGAAGEPEELVVRVKYRDELPWPVVADGMGPSLQLLDATRDNRRVGNWAVGGTNGLPAYTPGAANSVRTNLPVFPSLWLNELEPENTGAVVDSQGRRGPWVELYNSGSTALALDDYYLANNHTNLTQWRFPAGAVVGPGQYLVVWADGRAQETSGNEWHTSFSLTPGSGSVALVRVQGGVGAVMDYLSYAYLVAGRSYGAYPDGQPLDRRVFDYPTPEGANNPASIPAPVFLNEWMANNTRTVADPADNQFEDWLELYNAGTKMVELGGYELAVEGTNLTRFEVPGWVRLAPGERLLVWADGEPGQNSPTNQDLHVSFKLGREGETVSLKAPDGTLVDRVIFGAQTNDVSQGRYPDGTAGDYFCMGLPTPGTANVVASTNRPPVLDRIGDREVAEGTLLAFSAKAGDTNVGQRLTFSLVGAPAGAVIDSVSGAFEWVPTEAQGPGTFLVTVRVTDDGLPPMSAMERVTIKVSEVNTAPVLAPIADQQAKEGEVLSLNAGATDADLPAQTLRYRLEPGAPAGAWINPTNGVFNWLPSPAQGPATYPITVRVDDDGVPSLSATRSFAVTVEEVNTTPVLAPTGDQVVVEGQTMSFTVTATDADVPVQDLRYSLDPGAPAGASLEAATGLFNWTPTPAQVPSTNTVTIRVTDNGVPSLSTSETIRLFAVRPNHGPRLEPIVDQRVKEGELLRVTAVASDPDPGQALRFSLGAGAPAGASIGALNGVLEWTPGEAQGPGTNRITVRVDDDAVLVMSAEQTFTVIVEEVNTAPVLTSIGEKLVTGGETLKVTLTASDADLPSNRLVFNLVSGPAGAELKPTNGLFSWTPGNNQWPSTNVVTVRVSDDGTPPLSATQSFRVLVLAPQPWQYVSLTGTASSSVLYIYLTTPGDLYVDDVILVAGSEAGVGANALANGDFESPLEGVWTVSPNHAASARTGLVKHAGQSSLHLVATTGGTTRASSIYQDITPPLEANAPYTLSFWYLPGTNQTTLTVRLSGSGISSVVPVSPPTNRPPVLGTINDQVVALGDTLSFTVIATDPDLGQRLVFSLVSAPAGAAIEAGTGQFRWTPRVDQGPGTSFVTVQVSDNGVPPLSHRRTFAVEVRKVEIRLGAVRLTFEGHPLLSWSAEAGRAYAVEYQERLTEGVWQTLGEVKASGETGTYIDSALDLTQRYYRIRRK